MKLLYLFGFLICTYLAVGTYKEAYTEHVLAKNEGVDVVGKVIHVGSFCKRTNNRIKVLLKKRKYSLIISSHSCRKGKYQVGDNLKLVYIQRTDALFLKNKASGINYILSILYFILPLLFLIKLIKPIKK